MKLTDEDGIEYEFDGDSICANEIKGTLKKAKEWPQVGDKFYFIYVNGEVFVEEWSQYHERSEQIKNYTGNYKTQQEAEYARDRIKSLKDAHVSVFAFVGHNKAVVTLHIPIEYLKAWESLSNET